MMFFIAAVVSAVYPEKGILTFFLTLRSKYINLHELFFKFSTELHITF